MPSYSTTLGKMSETFSIDLTKVTDWNSFNQAMESYCDHLNDGIDDLAKEMGVTRECALDVWYLRGRSRHTPELEAKLINLHREGNPPNVCEFP